MQTPFFWRRFLLVLISLSIWKTFLNRVIFIASNRDYMWMLRLWYVIGCSFLHCVFILFVYEKCVHKSFKFLFKKRLLSLNVIRKIFLLAQSIANELKFNVISKKCSIFIAKTAKNFSSHSTSSQATNLIHFRSKYTLLCLLSLFHNKFFFSRANKNINEANYEHWNPVFTTFAAKM